MTSVKRIFRKSTNAKIIKTLQNNPGTWLTSSDIVAEMGFGQSRGIGKRLNYLQDDDPHIECMIDELTHKRYYRYNGVDKE